MDRNWWKKFAIVIGVAVLALWVLAPTLIYFDMPADQRGDQEAFAEAVPDWMREKHLALGLDLQGGIHLVLRVEVEKAVMNRTARRGEEILAYAEEQKIPLGSVKADRAQPWVKIEVPAESRADFDAKVLDYYQDMTLLKEEAGAVTLAFTGDSLDQIRVKAVEQAVKTIRNRVDKWGVSEPQIVKRGEDQVLVQLPGVKDPDRAKSLLGKTAQLEFRIAQDHQTGFLQSLSLPEGVVLGSEAGYGPGGAQTSAFYLRATDRAPLEAAIEAAEGSLPEGTDLLLQRIDGPGGEQSYRSWLTTDYAAITGEKLTDARVSVDQGGTGRPYVLVDFDRQGAVQFEELTEANVGRRMAIVLDETVSSAPVIQEKIGGGTARITMGGLQAANEVYQEANDLVLVLKAGALPAPVRVLEERSVGASLGPDLIERGLTALALGGVLVLLFMLVYYRLSGVVADVSLALNVVLLMSILAAFGATLTLPGIAGIVLTVGMAVDANVIIFERIREELALGKTARAAISEGYAKAFSAILDGNATTGIAAFVLLQYGTGPIKGFAVTLLAGIVSTLFCGVFVSRVFMELFNSKSETVSV